ncbi:hypothetical protein J6590_031310 [Homalodisca vitripennis]|nr:hypothetical protein J6590_031310 [Homalodisca vitripennis]
MAPLSMPSLSRQSFVFMGFFSFGNKKKSQGARSGEYGGCGIINVLFFCQEVAYKQNLFFHKSGRIWRIASHKLRITCSNIPYSPFYLVARTHDASRPCNRRKL